eukprot:s4108_g2.t1
MGKLSKVTGTFQVELRTSMVPKEPRTGRIKAKAREHFSEDARRPADPQHVPSEGFSVDRVLSRRRPARSSSILGVDVLLRDSHGMVWLTSALVWIWVFALPSVKALCPEMCMTSTGQQWPCRFYNNGCEVDTINNPNRSSVDDLHIAVIGPYSGNIGDIMTSAEPLLAIAAQEIEDSGILPGYRIHAHS